METDSFKASYMNSYSDRNFDSSKYCTSKVVPACLKHYIKIQVILIKRQIADSPFAGDFISDLAIQTPNVSQVKSPSSITGLRSEN